MLFRDTLISNTTSICPNQAIYNWIVRFSKEAVARTKDFKPVIGDTWVADETVIRVGGRKIWFWDVIDKDSRYILASRLSTSRTTKDAALVMKEAQKVAGKTPKRIITDKLWAYVDGIELVFGADTKHVQGKPFVDKDSTNIIERFHGTMKDRTNVIRGFKNMEKATLLTDAWIVHYNFFKEHEALGNVPPAQKMGKVPFKDWADVLDIIKDDMLRRICATAPAKRPVVKLPKVRVSATPRSQTLRRRKPRGDLYIGHGMVSRHRFRGARAVKLKRLS